MGDELLRWYNGSRRNLTDVLPEVALLHSFFRTQYHGWHPYILYTSLEYHLLSQSQNAFYPSSFAAVWCTLYEQH